MLLCYEATADLHTTPIAVESPMGTAQGVELVDKVGLIPVLRRRAGLVDGIWEMMPGAEVWHIGLYRDEQTLKPVSYYNKLPTLPTVQVCRCSIPCWRPADRPRLTVDLLKKWGARRVKSLAFWPPENRPTAGRIPTCPSTSPISIPIWNGSAISSRAWATPVTASLARPNRKAMVYLICDSGVGRGGAGHRRRWRALSFRLGILAEPGGRQHAGRIPKLGGLAVFAALARASDLLIGSCHQSIRKMRCGCRGSCWAVWW